MPGSKEDLLDIREPLARIGRLPHRYGRTHPWRRPEPVVAQPTITHAGEKANAPTTSFAQRRGAMPDPEESALTGRTPVGGTEIDQRSPFAGSAGMAVVVRVSP